MKRVVTIYWKDDRENSIEVFSNLKILCASYKIFNYNTLNNYLSKAKMPFENEDARIERIIVNSRPIAPRKIEMVATRVKMKKHDEEKQNLEYWLSRTPGDRLRAATQLSMQFKKRANERIDKTIHRKIRM